ncbi:MAG: 3-oxoadipate enol-lactonase [Celeribacter marinus]
MLQVTVLNNVALHYRYKPGTGTPIVFLNSLGTDFRIWDQVIDGLDIDAPILCIDKRGHGLSDDGMISMTVLVGDVATLMDHLDMQPALICGVSVGGMIAQGLAVERPDLVAGMVLCCTGAKIGDTDSWTARIETVELEGIARMADAILERWFSSGFIATRPAELAIYRNMLVRTSPIGYAGVCGAIRDTDFSAQSPRISVPTHCIAGSDDLATPPALVKDLASLIPNASYQVIPDCGHLPCIETPVLISDAIKQMHRTLT